MKKLLFLTSITFLFFWASCDNDKDEGMSDKTQKNLDASRTISKAFETGDIGAIDSVVASDFVDHTDRGDMGRDSLKAMIKLVHATNKDMNMKIIKEVADDEYVFTWMRFTGTSDGTMMPAGPYDMGAIEVTKLRDGKIVEHWEFMEMREMMKMMGSMPSAMPKADSSMKK